MVLGRNKVSLTFPGQSQGTSGNQEMNLINGEPHRGGTWAKSDCPRGLSEAVDQRPREL